MAARSGATKIKTHPIIAAVQGSEGGVRGLSGFLAEGPNGRALLYLDLGLGTALEINPRDILHIVEGAQATDPSLVLVDAQARIVVRQQTTVDALAAGEDAGCDCSDSAGTGVVYMAVDEGGDGPGATSTDCKKRYERCKKKCANKGAFKQGCYDSCAASYRLCKGGMGGAAGGGFVMF